ncbi:MAG: ABC transporter permease [Deltaproteobacteria bacterium]|nr:ABC transporter permease [Deltaproteobacteria bacterium]
MTSSWLARRYLRFSRRQHFLPLLTSVAILSITVGTFALCLILSVMEGFHAELSKRLLGLSAHISITPSDAHHPDETMVKQILSKFADVKDVELVIEGEAIAQNAVFEHDPPTLGLHLKGLDLEKLSATPAFDLLLAEKALPAGVPQMMLGSDAASTLHVHPDFQDALNLIAPLAEIGPAGDLVPRTRDFHVAGVFRTGYYAYDAVLAFVSREDAKRLLGEQASATWQIRLSNPQKAASVAASITSHLPTGWKIISWDEENKKLFSALRLERLVMAVILFITIIIASFSVMGVVSLISASKRRDIAILKSLGMPKGMMYRLFLASGAWIGAMGGGLGAVLGTIACLLLDRWQLPLPPAYYLPTLPVSIEPFAYVLFALMGVSISILASVYPVSQAIGEDPCEVLRYE